VSYCVRVSRCCAGDADVVVLLNAWSGWLGEAPALETLLRSVRDMLRSELVQQGPTQDDSLAGGEGVLARLTPLLVLKVGAIFLAGAKLTRARTHTRSVPLNICVRACDCVCERERLFMCVCVFKYVYAVHISVSVFVCAHVCVLWVVCVYVCARERICMCVHVFECVCTCV
jgi:hypothetical protein